MGSLLLDLIPELLGMAITPAAIAGCILLLQTKQALKNALAFASAFMLAYIAIGVAALLGGATHQTQQSGTIAHWAGLVVGLIFVGCGVGTLVRHRSAAQRDPKWMDLLEKATPRVAFLLGAALSVLNPNLAIMVSGMSVIAAADTTVATSIGATVLLLVAAALDFLVPIGAYVAFGDRAKAALESSKRWMLTHNGGLSMAVFFGFGALFVIRGVVALV
ncbi:hypothetical protein G4X40_04875 [Rhodococcus sp. D2-41]|uniref:GAP family protein n=1 Tax=Speluncibacter jeojiensis TaxID=2710754 RepID=A0A9X4M3K6_9ACTN|nr:GAP family protein [Rhodococcus sp. D2-41]MDG3009476.1 hypothetical protein [Rhodococcus sp. D2-41]MDG3016405.1 GAP family protein [Corynebacteriales bacterium D3-21]